MTTFLLISAVALLSALAVLRRATACRGTEAVTAADVGVVLGAAEIVLLIDSLVAIGVVVGPAPAVLEPVLAAVGIGLVIAGSFLRWVGTTVTALGVLSAIAEAWLQDGATVGATLLALVALLWMINRIVRLLAP